MKHDAYHSINFRRKLPICWSLETLIHRKYVPVTHLQKVKPFVGNRLPAGDLYNEPKLDRRLRKPAVLRHKNSPATKDQADSSTTPQDISAGQIRVRQLEYLRIPSVHFEKTLYFSYLMEDVYFD